MKSTIFITVLIFSLNSLVAQTIDLPVYKQGIYELDTIYSYYGPLPISGQGGVSFGGTLTSNFISGVKFKMIVDSTNKGSSPTHAAFRDSLGTLVAIYKGDTLDIPVALQLFAGDVGFHIIIEGTPLLAGQSYLCDLKYTFTSGNDWEMLLLEKSQSTCIVDQPKGVEEKNYLDYFNVYPNPANDLITIKTNKNQLGITYTIIDQLGRTILTGKLTNEITAVDINQFAAGVYSFQVGELGKQTFKVLKK